MDIKAWILVCMIVAWLSTNRLFHLRVPDPKRLKEARERRARANKKGGE